MPLRSEVLDYIRSARENAHLADSDDEELLLKAHVMPKTFLTAHFGSYPIKIVRQLVSTNRVYESEHYLRANPRDRTRPIATMYNVAKPLVNPRTRNAATYRMFGRDRLALWAAAANKELSGSRGEAYGLWLILKFWRLPNVQRIWRRFIERPTFRLPEDAR